SCRNCPPNWAETSRRLQQPAMDPVSFASSSKLLELRWAREGHRRHRQKVSSIKHSQALPSEPPPKSYPHLTVRLKKLQQEEERNAEIDRENRLLVEKLSGIINKPSDRLDNWNAYESAQLQIVHKASERRRRQRALMRDNQAMSNRLLGIRSSYDHTEHKHIKEMLDSTTKDYTFNTGGRRAGGGTWIRSAGAQRPPHSFAHAVVVGLYIRQGHSKPWRANAKQAKPRQVPQKLYDNEARMLMKVCNKIVQPNEILLKCLVKKSPKQRQAIRVRFRELYDLDLESQLKQSLPKEYRGLVEGLLHNPYLKVVTEIHANIKDIDPFALLTRCTQHDKACLKKLLDVYKKRN
uniref:Annexin n=1 Tax=Macrostomum lignano TaxID=282301 RepID=A0A1I8G804_9PLAT